MNKKSIITLILLAACCLSSASADVVWIGRPTVRDYFAYSAQRAFEQAQEMQQSIAAFNRKIADARTAYFGASPADRAAAGDKFGELLLEKDLLIAMPEVMGGGGDQARLLSNLMKLMNKGELPDRGIPASAASAYGEWVADLQFRSGGVGRMPDPIKGAQALQNGESLKSYEKYRRLRDQAELDEDEASRNGGVRKLMEHGSLAASEAIGKTDAVGFDYAMRSVFERVLRCVYGGRTAATYYFWEGRAPQNITALMAMNYTAGSNALALLKDHAVAACPPDSKQAAVLASVNLKEPLTMQMLKEGRAQAESMPLTPEQTAQRAAARQVSIERKALSDARADAFRACHDAMTAESEAARREHRPFAGAAQNLECNKQVRIKYPDPEEQARIAQADDKRANQMALSGAFRECMDEMRAAGRLAPSDRDAQQAARQRYEQCTTTARNKYQR